MSKCVFSQNLISIPSQHCRFKTGLTTLALSTHQGSDVTTSHRAIIQGNKPNKTEALKMVSFFIKGFSSGVLLGKYLQWFKRGLVRGGGPARWLDDQKRRGLNWDEGDQRWFLQHSTAETSRGQAREKYLTTKKQQIVKKTTGSNVGKMEFRFII